MVKKKYRAYVKPEGESDYIPINQFFKTKIEASTWTGVESVAGMGEEYIFKKVMRRR